MQSSDPLGLGSTYSGEDAGLVYHVMATRAFGQLASKLRETFFRPGTAAYAGKSPTGSTVPTSGVQAAGL